MEDKRILITGGTQGIGLALATSLAEQGAEVIAVARRPRPELTQFESFSCDQGDEDAVAQLFSSLRKSHGSLDGLVINAGVLPQDGPLLEADSSDFEAAWRINTLGVLHMLKHGAALLRDGAAVVVTATPASQYVFPAYATYGASKSALELLVRHAAVELGARGVRVNAVKPGTILTDMQPDDDAEARMCRHTTCLQRPGRVAEVLGTFQFLLSDASIYVTASTVTVDGGWLGGVTPGLVDALVESNA